MSPAAKKLAPLNELGDALTKVALFADIRANDAALSALHELMRELRFRAGQTIIKEGDQGEDFFILAEGSAGVYKTTSEGDSYKVAILHGHQGTFFGEGALLEADTRTATITADTDCLCFVLAAKDFDRFCKAHPDWAMPILKRVAHAIMHRLKNMNRDLSLLYKALVDEFSRNHE
jgi:CRP-like cAMP-binding protein